MVFGLSSLATRATAIARRTPNQGSTIITKIVEQLNYVYTKGLTAALFQKLDGIAGKYKERIQSGIGQQQFVSRSC